jgi:hypothetical protein
VHCHTRHAWRNLLKQLQPFRAHAVFPRRKTGAVAAGPRQTLDEARANRIGDEREHDRHAACRAPQRLNRRAPRSEDHVGRKRDQLRRVLARVILAAPGPAVVDLNVVAEMEFVIDRASGRMLGGTASGIWRRAVLDKVVYTSQPGYVHVQLLQIREFEDGPVKPFLLVDGTAIHTGNCTHLR